MDLRLFRNKAFLSLWLTTLTSMFAIAVAWVAESWYAINVLHREKEYGYILLASMTPRIVFMLIGGAVADRFSRRKVVGWSLSIRAALLLGLAALIALEWAGFTVILLAAFLYGVIDAYYWPSRDAILVDILPAQDLPRANSIMLTTGQIGWIAGPALGGFLTGYFSLSTVLFALSAILFAMAMLFMGLLRQYTDHAPRSPDTVERSRRENLALFAQDLKTGLLYVKNHPQFSVLMLLFAVANILFMGPMQQSVPLIAKDLSGSASAFGTMWASWGAGMAAGGVAMSILAPQHKRFLIVTGMVLVESLLLIALAFLHSALAVYAVMFAIGLCIACNNIPTLSMLQIYADKDKVGRVMGLNDTISLGLTPLSYIGVSALLLAGVDYRTILTVAGVAMFIFSAYMVTRYPVIRHTD